jgi:hypothetical protein
MRLVFTGSPRHEVCIPGYCQDVFTVVVVVLVVVLVLVLSGA